MSKGQALWFSLRESYSFRKENSTPAIGVEHVTEAMVIITFPFITTAIGGEHTTWVRRIRINIRALAGEVAMKFLLPVLKAHGSGSACRHLGTTRRAYFKWNWHHGRGNRQNERNQVLDDISESQNQVFPMASPSLEFSFSVEAPLSWGFYSKCASFYFITWSEALFPQISTTANRSG